MNHSPFDLGPAWNAILDDELKKPYIQELASFVQKERAGPIPIYPPQELVFNAFLKTPFDKVKVLIMGQDPYHGPGQAHGLSFSVPPGVKPPPSLVNIFKEIEADLKIPPPKHGCLIAWAEQGVMLLNATLTVRQGQPMSHAGQGWEKFTDAVVEKLAARDQPLIFVLWGKSAQNKCRHIYPVIGAKGHILLTAPHPSPFSAHQGFLGCRHFSLINQALVSMKQAPIQWNL